MNITFFSNLVLLSEYFDTYYTLNMRSQVKQFCFPEITDDSRYEIEGNIRNQGKTKLTGFPRNLTLSVLLYF